MSVDSSDDSSNCCCCEETPEKRNIIQTKRTVRFFSIAHSAQFLFATYIHIYTEMTGYLKQCTMRPTVVGIGERLMLWKKACMMFLAVSHKRTVPPSTLKYDSSSEVD